MAASIVVDQPSLLTREQAAEYLGVKAQTRACWASAKRYGLPFVRVGRSVRYRRADLDRWLDARTVGAVADEK